MVLWLKYNWSLRKVIKDSCTSLENNLHAVFDQYNNYSLSAQHVILYIDKITSNFNI